MLTIKYQTAFKKDYKYMKKRGYDMRLLENVIHMLAKNPRLKPGIYVCRIRQL